MALFDLAGRRWTLRVLWELREPAPSFRALQAACEEISSSVLWKRVGELKDARIVEAVDGGGLRLTPQGEDLLESFAPLNAFAERWARG
jgi:DNA-binding HxlR family transcriptional regulator